MGPLTREQIESSVEGADFDFKARLNLDDAATKSSIVDDAVAFLNRGAGRILIGVQERGGAFSQYSPLAGDPDKQALRLQSILQDSIEPRPLDIVVASFPLEGGHLLDVRLPEHRMRPYQNRLTGGFVLRTGAKNTPMRPDEVRAAFAVRDGFESAVRRLATAQANTIERRKLMLTDGPALEISILPSSHYERRSPKLGRTQGLLRAAPAFHEYGSAIFSGCEGGHEALQVTLGQGALERLYVGHDSFIHAHVVHPIGYDGERVRLSELKLGLTDYLEAIEELCREVEVAGPFCTMIAIHGVERFRYAAQIFPGTQTIAQPFPIFSERLSASEMAIDFYDLVRATSVYG